MLRIAEFVTLLTLIILHGSGTSWSEEELAFPLVGDIRGSEVLLDKRPARVMIGEIHGTQEIPPLVAVLIRLISSKGETVVCLEMAASEQSRLDAFLASDGGTEAVRELLSGPHWLMPDGRAGVGHLKMLQLIRQLVQSGRQVHVAAIDLDPTQQGSRRKKPLDKLETIELARNRDQQMAQNVHEMIAKHPNANLVILVGNIHVSVQPGAPWDAEYKPLGWHLKQEMPELVSLNFQSSGGEAWVLTDKGAGPRAFPGIDRGDEPFVELYDEAADGYHGLFYVGRISPASPAREPRSRIGDALRELRKRIPPAVPENATQAE